MSPVKTERRSNRLYFRLHFASRVYSDERIADYAGIDVLFCVLQ